jgi:hypothetical protein
VPADLCVFLLWKPSRGMSHVIEGKDPRRRPPNTMKTFLHRRDAHNSGEMQEGSALGTSWSDRRMSQSRLVHIHLRLGWEIFHVADESISDIV